MGVDMGGTDTDVLKIQLDVLHEALTLHRLELQNAEQEHVAALGREHKHKLAAVGARAEADQWATVVEQQRAAIHELALDIDDIQTAQQLRSIPAQVGG